MQHFNILKVHLVAMLWSVIMVLTQLRHTDELYISPKISTIKRVLYMNGWTFT